jgi:hypothetical protein
MTTTKTQTKTKKAKHGKGSSITFKGSAANRLFAQIAVDLGGENPTKNMVPGTELHRMTTEEIAKKKDEADVDHTG